MIPSHFVNGLPLFTGFPDTHSLPQEEYRLHFAIYYIQILIAHHFLYSHKTVIRLGHEVAEFINTCEGT